MPWGGSVVAQERRQMLMGGRQERVQSVVIPSIPSAVHRSGDDEVDEDHVGWKHGDEKNYWTVARGSLGRVFQERRYFSQMATSR